MRRLPQKQGNERQQTADRQQAEQKFAKIYNIGQMNKMEMERKDIEPKLI